MRESSPGPSRPGARRLLSRRVRATLPLADGERMNPCLSQALTVAALALPGPSLSRRPRRRQKKVVLSAWESGPSGLVAWPDLRVGVFASDSESPRLAVPVEHATLRARATGSPARRGISNHDRQEEGSHLLGSRARVASGGPEMRPVAGHAFLGRTRHGGLGPGHLRVHGRALSAKTCVRHGTYESCSTTSG